ncbi:MAG TPA: hypothetical protein VGH28_32210 [Polyangiaceae bacterium]
MSADPRQVPTLPVTVEVDLASGRTLRATLFLSITSSRREGPETLDEFFNTARRLLPVAVGDKRELVTREAIVTVRVTSDIAPRDAEEVAPAIDLVKVELASGKSLDGAVRHDAGTRLSDFFNDAPDFFAVEDTGGVVWVNKRHVVSISM